MPSERFREWITWWSGALCGAALTAWCLGSASAKAQPQPVKPPPDLASLAAEIETIKGKLPDQAHAMLDVGQHFANLWFAAREKHWDLARFYWAETRSHLRWAVRIIPKRKDRSGREIDLQAILQALENSPLKQLEEAIGAKDSAAFKAAYRSTLEGCYSCHKAADKPFIRPHLPTAPETTVIDLRPSAEAAP